MNMQKNWKKVRKVLRDANVVLEVLDARFARATRDKSLEQSCIRADKKLLIVINKADLVSGQERKKLLNEFSKEADTVLVSAKKKKGKKMILRFLHIFAQKKKVFACIVGLPNTGKSSLVNYLKGKHSARTSIQAGVTRGKQYFRIAKNIMLVDNPGVIPFDSISDTKLAFYAAKSPQQLKDPQKAAQKIMKHLQKEGAKEMFGVPLVGNDYEQLLCEIALKKNRLKKGGEPDTQAMAGKIIVSWQKGELEKELAK